MPQCMLDGSLRLIDTRSDQRRRQDHNWNMACTLTRAVQKFMLVDTRYIAEVVVEEIGACLDSPQGTPSYLQGAYSLLKRWYRHAPMCQPQHSWTDLEKVSGDNTALYQWEDPPLPVWPFPTHIILFRIYYETPTEGES